MLNGLLKIINFLLFFLILIYINIYNGFSGIGLGIKLTLHGLFGLPAKFLPIIEPNKVNGKMMNSHIANIVNYLNIELINIYKHI